MTQSTDFRVDDYRFALQLLTALVVIAAGTVPAMAADAVAQAQMKLGREVFTTIAVPQCGICHALKDAGSTGEIGAKLDELKPDAARVAAAVRKGLGVMPPYAGKLTDAQIAAVAHYVAQVTRTAD